MSDGNCQMPMERNRFSRIGLTATWVLAAALWLWSLLALWFFPAWPSWMQFVVTIIALAVSVGHCWHARRIWKPLGLIAGFLLVRGLWEFNRPSNDRVWIDVNARTVSAELNGDQVRIRNFRSAHWRTAKDYDLNWEERTYDLAQLRTVDFVISPFAFGRTFAHTFLTFGFADGEYVAISVEIRRERGESYSPVRGMFRHYEVTYVVGDETDLIALRTEVNQDPVYLFPIRTPVEKVRGLFVSLLQNANRLREQPEFYHTVLNTCHLHVVQHVNALRRHKIGFDWRNLLPGYADELASELGLIDFDGSLEQARERFLINSRSAPVTDRKVWSRQIRQVPRSPVEPASPRPP
jgi:hypothetical protein